MLEKALVETRILLGEPCDICGGVQRYINRYSCVACSKRRAKERRAKDPLRKRAEGKQWASNNREKMREYNRAYRERKKTTPEFRSMRRRHRGYPEPTRPEPTQCEMCGSPPNINQMIYLDHCHRTNVFRGWLCGKCNIGLGALGDDIDLAIEWLTKYKSVVERKP